MSFSTKALYKGAQSQKCGFYVRFPETETREEWETTPVTLLEKEAHSVLNRITNVGKTLVVFSLRISSSCCDMNSVRKHIDVFTK